jgi:predicted dehydrogenase
VHVWSSARYTGGRFVPGDKPAGLDWDLWLGPARERPYSPDIHPFAWRKFWDFGAGALGDFGCHYMDLAHWALDLGSPERIEAEGPPVDAVSPPEWCVVHYDYPARGDRPPVKLHWYDSGRQPPVLAEVLAEIASADGKPATWSSGQLFVGSEGRLLSDYGRHRLLPATRFADVKPPEPSIPRSVGHHREFVEAILAGRDASGRAAPTTCNFGYSGRLTEAVLLGVASYRAGRPIRWDGDAARALGSADIEPFLHKEYRKGWTL